MPSRTRQSEHAPHPEEWALLQATVENPNDESTWLVLADWLEEQDPRRADLLRLHRRLLATCCEPEKHSERAGWQTRLVELLAEGVQPCVPRRTVVLREGVEMAFSWIPPGTFLMGSPEDEEGRRKNETLRMMTLTAGFWLGIHPVTQAQWQAVTDGNPSYFMGEDRPVECITRDACQTFCRRLEEKTGHRFRLPMEAEWEYACRAGTTTPFFFGTTITTGQANFDGNYILHRSLAGLRPPPGQTSPVGSFPSNAFGLSDMHGNVWEWCSHWFAAYDHEEAEDPRGSDAGDTRVLRGGSWSDGPNWCRSACRPKGVPNACAGCRVVLCLD